MKIALTGAAGHLGAAILQEVCKRKIPLKALLRNNDTRACEGLEVEIIRGDLFHPGALQNLLQGCDTVIHCAALISVNGDPGGLVHRTNVQGTHAIINAAMEAGVKRCIHISSIHAFQQEPSFELLNEQRATVTEKGFAYDRSKLAGQQIALAANEKGMEVLVMNPTAIIGPYDFKPSRMGKVISDLYKGRLPFIFNGGFDFCDCRDVANAIVNAATMGRPGEVYLLAGKWHSLQQLAQIFSKLSGKRIKPFILSPMIAKAALPVVKLIGAVQKKEPLYTVEAMDALFKGNRCISSAKAIADLDYTTRPLEETLHDTFRWFKNNGYLD